MTSPVSLTGFPERYLINFLFEKDTAAFEVGLICLFVYFLFRFPSRFRLRQTTKIYFVLLETSKSDGCSRETHKTSSNATEITRKKNGEETDIRVILCFLKGLLLEFETHSDVSPSSSSFHYQTRR